MAVALLWLTIPGEFLGPTQTSTHPPAHDRLFQVLDSTIDQTKTDEYEHIWHFIAIILFCSMQSAGFAFTASEFDGILQEWRDVANHLIDRISREDRRQGDSI